MCSKIPELPPKHLCDTVQSHAELYSHITFHDTISSLKIMLIKHKQVQAEPKKQFTVINFTNYSFLIVSITVAQRITLYSRRQKEQHSNITSFQCHAPQDLFPSRNMRCSYLLLLFCLIGKLNNKLQSVK